MRPNIVRFLSEAKMNKNAPYIREIIDRTNQIKGVQVQGSNKTEIKENVLLILQQQRQQQRNQNVRTQTY